MTETEIKFARERAERYNIAIRQAIPGYEASHGMADSWLQTNLSESARLPIVGSGTEMELVNYCQPNSEWTLTGVEPSAEMLAITLRLALRIAEAKLVSLGYRERVNLYPGYVNTLLKTEPMDPATIILVMHFLSDNGSKLQLLQNIAQRLKLKAKLVIAELYGDKSLPYFAKFRQAWQTLYFNKLDRKARAKAEANFQTSIARSIYFISEARMIELLQAAGFNLVTKFYNAFLFGGWIARYTTGS